MNFKTSHATAKGHLPSVSMCDLRIMSFDLRQLGPQHLNAGLRQLPSGSKRRMTDSPC